MTARLENDEPVIVGDFDDGDWLGWQGGVKRRTARESSKSEWEHESGRERRRLRAREEVKGGLPCDADA
jgi:hypothetical protein